MLKGSIKDHVFPKLMLLLEAEVVATFAPRSHASELVIPRTSLRKTVPFLKQGLGMWGLRALLLLYHHAV